MTDDAHAAAAGRVVTPCLVVDAAVLVANLELQAARCAAAGVALRPHVKGHRSVAIAQRQLALGAVGVAAATLAEARTMVAGGVGDVLLTSVLPPSRAADAVRLAQRARRLTLVVHDRALVNALDEAAEQAGQPLEVLLDLDVGQRRGGVTPGGALGLADAVRGTGRLTLVGVQGYEGHLQGIVDEHDRAVADAGAMTVLAETVAQLREHHHGVGWVTTGGTGTAATAAAHPVVTEVQPGSYALMDATYARTEGVPFAQAVWVEASVLAVLGPDEVIIDAGLKALSTDMGPAQPAAPLQATYAAAGDEHGRLTGDLAGLAVGDLVRLTPSHSDTTVALHPLLYGTDHQPLERALAGITSSP